MQITKRQFKGIPFDGIIFQKAQRVDMGATRGIVFDRPDRFLINTPFGQLEIHHGDWVVKMPTGNLYVIKAADVDAFDSNPKVKKWWHLW